MNCYFCEDTLTPGGMRIKSITADGVCHDCGAAVCREHGKRTVGRAAVLLCRDCAERRAETSLSTGRGIQSA